MKNSIVFLFCYFVFTALHAQSQNEKKQVLPDSVLFKKIANLDSALFVAYNSKKLNELKTFFTSDLEWFQDNGGLMNYDKVFVNFQEIFNKDYDLKRNLVEGSLEVYPIQGYGAIEIGNHQFKHVENGKLEIGTFKFVMIWKNDHDKWKISRVISFNH